jgi:glycine/D-amino acid oxidase-like deaminating enzyme
VIRQGKDVSKLLIIDGVCHGVECVGGISIAAKTTIVATGPWTLALLKSLRIQLPHDLEDGFFGVTAIGVATLPLDKDKYKRFKSMSILVTRQGMIKLLI